MSVRLTRAYLPGKVFKGRWVEVLLQGHVESDTTNPGVAIWYSSGPTRFVEVKLGSRILRVDMGSGVVVFIEATKPRCTYIAPDEGAWIRFPEIGSYVIELCAGYVENNVMYVTDRRSFTIDVVEGAPPSQPVSITSDVVLALGVAVTSIGVGMFLRRPEIAGLGTIAAGGYLVLKGLRGGYG